MKEILLTKGKIALVDDADYEELNQFKWACTNHGYARRSEGDRKIYMHRQISRCLENEQVDHRNLNKLDNRRENLRICSQSENLRNQAVRKNNKLGVKGVIFNMGLYRASLMHNGVLVLNKRFKTLEQAKAAYDAAALKHQGEFSRS